MHASWYCREYASKTDIEDKKLLNKVITFVLFAHKKYSHSLVKFKLKQSSHNMSLLPFWALNMVVALLSFESQKAFGFHQKYINLCSGDDQRFYGFGMT